MRVRLSAVVVAWLQCRRVARGPEGCDRWSALTAWPSCLRMAAVARPVMWSMWLCCGMLRKKDRLGQVDGSCVEAVASDGA